MVKFESVVKNIDDSITTNGIFFVLDKNKINYIYSDNKKQLADIFSIITGFYKPNIGGLIYDDYDLNQFNLSDKFFFIRKNISIICPFNSDDKNMTVIDYLLFHSICIFEKKQDRISIINQLLKEFDLDYFKNTKIKMLSNKLIIKLMLASAKLSNPKYLFFYGIEQYISTIDSYFFFVDLISQNFKLEDITLTIFVNQIPNKKTGEKIDIKIINLDDLATTNDELLIRDNKLLEHKDFSGNFFKLFFWLFKKNFFFNFLNVVLFVFLGLIFSLSLVFLFEGNSNRIFVILSVVFLSCINFIFSVYSSIAIYKNIKNNLFLITRWGISIIECLWLLILHIFFLSLMYSTLWLLPLIIGQFVFQISINWVLSLALLLFILLISSLTLILFFIINNRKMVKKYDENW